VSANVTSPEISGAKAFVNVNFEQNNKSEKKVDANIVVNFEKDY